MGTLEIAQGNADTVDTLEIAQANIGADDKFGTELGGVEATSVAQGSDAHASSVDSVDTLEIAQANIGAGDKLGTQLGGVEATSALQIAVVTQEITPAGDKLPTTPQEPLSLNEKSQKELLLAEYCTQACLLGLKRRSGLDEDCPNVASHRLSEDSTHHQIDAETLTGQVREQISEFSDRGCTHLGKSGSKGSLFKLMLFRYGYTFVGKGTKEEHIPNLRHEAVAYQQRLNNLQGEVVSVYLGSIDMVTPYRIFGRRVVVYMILMSWSGETLEEMDIPTHEADRTVQEVMRKGVVHNDMFSTYNGSRSKAWRSVRDHTVYWGTDLHRQSLLGNMRKNASSKDIGDRNMVWNSERKRVMLIDFDRSLFIDEEFDESDEPKEPGQSDELEESGPKRKAGAQEGVPSKKIKVVNNTTIKGCSLGLLGALPNKLRKIIYEYALSTEPRSHGKPKSGLGLLTTSTMIYKETIPLIYQSQLFGVEINTETLKSAYKYLKPGVKDISLGTSIEYLSPDMLDFVQNLQVQFKHGAETCIKWRLRSAMEFFCDGLQYNTYLQSLHTSMEFPTANKDDEDRVIVAISAPIKKLLRERVDITTTSGYGGNDDRNTRLTFAYNKRQ